MSSFEFVSALLLLAAILGIVNHRYVHLPRTIGLMAGSLILSIIIILVDRSVDVVELRSGGRIWSPPPTCRTCSWMGCWPSCCSPAACMSIWTACSEQKWTVLALATLGVLLATALYGFGIWFIFAGTVPLPWCFALGALLAPDRPDRGRRPAEARPACRRTAGGGERRKPVQRWRRRRHLRSHAGMGQRARHDRPATIGLELLTEAGGGIALGLATGYLAYRALHLINEPALELTITLALVTVTYSLAAALHVSGPLAVVVAGLLTGHRSTRFAMTDLSREQVILFWDMMDELLNAVLFLLMGFALLSVEIDVHLLIAAASGIALALVTRLISVAIPTTLVHLRQLPKLRGIAVLTWGGLRGGISVALALTLEPSPYRGALLAICYAVVVFTILVQGLSMPMLVRRLYRPTAVPPQSP